MITKLCEQGELYKRYNKLKMTEEDVHLLDKYFDAFVGLYGVIPVKKALDIIKEQNPKKYTDQQLKDFCEIKIREQHKYYFEEPDDDKSSPLTECDLAHISLYDHGVVDEGGYSDIKLQQGEKPYYIPDKEVLLEYSCEFYHEKFNSAKALQDYIEKNVQFRIEDVTAKSIVDDFINDSKMFPGFLENVEEDLSKLLDPTFAIFNMERSAFFDELVDLAMVTYNNSRMWVNRGYSPNELAAKMINKLNRV